MVACAATFAVAATFAGCAQEADEPTSALFGGPGSTTISEDVVITADPDLGPAGHLHDVGALVGAAGEHLMAEPMNAAAQASKMSLHFEGVMGGGWAQVTDTVRGCTTTRGVYAWTSSCDVDVVSPEDAAAINKVMGVRFVDSMEMLERHQDIRLPLNQIMAASAITDTPYGQLSAAEIGVAVTSWVKSKQGTLRWHPAKTTAQVHTAAGCAFTVKFPGDGVGDLPQVTSASCT